MTARILTAAGKTWRFSADDLPPLAEELQVVLEATLFDESTGAAPIAPVTVTTGVPGLTPSAVDGVAGLVGRPLACYAPGAVAGAPLDMRLTAPGFIALDLSGTLPAQPGYPDAFAPCDLGNVSLHRAPTAISGRVVSHTHVPRAAATVTLSGFWPAQADLLNPKSVPNIIALSQGLYRERPAGATLVRQDVTAASPAEAKTLLIAAAAGSDRLRLSDQQGLAVGTLLIVDIVDRVEIIAVNAIVEAGATADQPATAVLDHPLRIDHRAGVRVIRGVAAAAGAANLVTRPGHPGDVSVYLDGMLNIDGTMTTARISSAGLADEYHGAIIYRATSDASGYFRLPPIHRAAQIELRATHAAEPLPLTRPVTLDWNAGDLVLDLVFS